ncbi:MAG: HlyD family efflux transporter periplasmic adaptor subunit, partial [Paracoccaceae bacterium]
LDAAKAEAERAQAALDDRVVLSPATGLIEKVFFDVGEVAGAGAPTIAILQPDKLKVIFFVPEPERAGFALGDRLSVACDGCPDGVTATVTRMASDPQYTPPVIYSREERTRLVYRAEARLGSPEGLLPGQPVTLRRLP